MPAPDRDTAIRLAAFDHVRLLADAYGHLTAELLRPGFVFEGERIPLVNQQRGIFKPAQMRYLLSITTRVPRPGQRVWYDDQINVHRQIYEGDQSVEYSFMGRDPEAADNRWLREAFENRVPIIYFIGVAPGVYQPELPVYLSGWNPETLSTTVVFGDPEEARIAAPVTAAERRYALRHVKQRLHQSAFREAVITAYGGRCAASRLPEHRLLDAAHIVADRDEKLGQPLIQNGIPLSKIHHAAFDAHLIGIDPDYGIHVSERLLSQKDGPMLEALKRLQGGHLHLPTRKQDYPDRDRLALRFEQFKRHVA